VCLTTDREEPAKRVIEVNSLNDPRVTSDKEDTAQNPVNCQTTCNDVQSLCDGNYQSNNNLQFTKLIAFSKKNTNHGRKLPGS